MKWIFKKKQTNKKILKGPISSGFSMWLLYHNFQGEKEKGKIKTCFFLRCLKLQLIKKGLCGPNLEPHLPLYPLPKPSQDKGQLCRNMYIVHISIQEHIPFLCKILQDPVQVSVNGGRNCCRTIWCAQCSAFIHFGSRQNESLFPTDSNESRSSKEIKRT